MAIPPDTSGFDTGEEIELSENCFVFGGYSVQYLKPFRVVDLTDGGRELRVRLEEDLRIEGDPKSNMPGASQTVGTIRVWFEPSIPGHRYRCETPMGSRIGVLTP